MYSLRFSLRAHPLTFQSSRGLQNPHAVVVNEKRVFFNTVVQITTAQRLKCLVVCYALGKIGDRKFSNFA